MPGKGKPFLPGNNANPKGRPKKGCALTDILNKIGDEPHGETGITKKEALGQIMFDKALQGDFQFWKYLSEKTDGPVVVKIDQTVNMPDIIEVDITDDETDDQADQGDASTLEK